MNPSPGLCATKPIGADPERIAETVLMPGDPYRAKWAAETFLDGVEPVNQVRGMLGSRLIDSQSQKITAAASAMADRKTFGQRS